MSGYISGGWSNQPVPGLSSVVDTLKGVARDASDRRAQARAANSQHEHAMAQMAQAHQYGIQRDLFQHNLGTTARNMEMLQEQRMAYLNDSLQRKRDTLARAAETRSASKAHKRSKDMVTHVATTLGSIPGRGPITGMSVPGGSVTFGEPEAPKPRRARKAAPPPTFSSPGADPGPQSDAPRTPRRPL